MKVEFLTEDRIEDFVSYCKKYKVEIDESFLYDEDLNDFHPNDENPTYIVTNDQNELIGTASLIMNDYHRRGQKARFRIFHSEVDDIACFTMLMEAISKHVEGLNHLFIFVPTVNKKLMQFMEDLTFTIDRYAFLLVREDLDLSSFVLPEGYEIRKFRTGLDEDIVCEVRNTAFMNLKGSETPITPEMVKKMIGENDYLEGGLMLLYHNEKPVGVVRGATDEYEGGAIMNIGPLAVIPEYQGQGLGRILLRASLQFAREKGFDRTILCVNADNERAKALYIQEGFQQVEAVVCYKYDLPKK